MLYYMAKYWKKYNRLVTVTSFKIQLFGVEGEHGDHLCTTTTVKFDTF